MSTTRYVTAVVVSVSGLAAGFALSARRSADANECPATPPGYELHADVQEWKYDGDAKSIHTPNDHGDVVHAGTTSANATAFKKSGNHPKLDSGWGNPNEEPVVCNNEPCEISLSTPFFNGKKELKATSNWMGSDGSGDGVIYFSPTVTMKGAWGALKLLNAKGTFKITCGNRSSQRKDDYHDIDLTSATLQKIMRIFSWGVPLWSGTILDGASVALEDLRGGIPKYVHGEGGELVVDENGIPTLDLDENGGTQWSTLPTVMTRLTSSVSANADEHTITYTYVLENMTAGAIPFSIAQVPVSPTENGWSGEVSGESSLQTSITVDESMDQDIYRENAYLELKVDGSAEFNEGIGGQIYVPKHRAEFHGACTITAITCSGLPAKNHVTILLSGDSAEDIYLFRDTPAGSDCVGEMHGTYVADETYTVESEDAPQGPVTYHVSVGKGVNKYNSAEATTQNL